MEYPAAGMAIQKACYAEYSACFVDTFYLDSLKNRLTRDFQTNKYAVFAYVDSVKHYQTFDTTFYHGVIYYIDTFQTEDVHVGIHTFLKDTLPTRQLKFTDRWAGFTGNPLATTYFPLLDTPFVAFFNEYDSIHKVGLGPMDGCFFEPTAFLIHDNRIFRTGQHGDRVAGISVTMPDFFQAVGLAPVPVPPVGIYRPSRLPPGRRTPALRPHRYDVNGRRVPSRKVLPELFYLWDSRPGGNITPANPTDD